MTLAFTRNNTQKSFNQMRVCLDKTILLKEGRFFFFLFLLLRLKEKWWMFFIMFSFCWKSSKYFDSSCGINCPAGKMLHVLWVRNADKVKSDRLDDFRLKLKTHSILKTTTVLLKCECYFNKIVFRQPCERT